jgi:hypothetical protein
VLVEGSSATKSCIALQLLRPQSRALGNALGQFTAPYTAGRDSTDPYTAGREVNHKKNIGGGKKAELT